MTEEIDIARQWIAKAYNDLLNADNNLQSKKIPYDTVCFHCQQATEKLLKAYLVSIGKSPPITHDLMLLLERILPSEREAEELRDSLALLMPYAVEIRYPDEGFMPTVEDTQEAREAAELVLKWLKVAMPTLFEEC
jgi:HEPN domain-containing protein